MPDYYNILGVDKGASQEDIKRAFRKLAHRHHPDKQGGNEKKFKEINEAYQVLGNKEKRAQYDQFGGVFGDGQGFGQGSGGFDPGSFWQGAKGGFGGMDFSDIFESFFGSGVSRKGKNPNRGEDIEIGMKINLEDTLKGVEEDISLAKMVKCRRCQGLGAEPGSKLKECFSCRGTGQVQQMRRTVFGIVARYIVCPECKGEGKIPEKPCNVCRGGGKIRGQENIKVFIPAGIDTGQTIRIDGKGGAGRRGGKAGDLYVKIFVKAHKVFKRRGDDLYLSLPVTFSQAALGDSVEVPTLEGKKLVLKIPQGIESGKVLRISGKGIPHFTGWGKGNLYIGLVVKTPKKLTRKQKELLQELKKEGL